MSVTRPVVKTETLKKKNQTSLDISLPLESGQLERWYFHLGASNGISLRAKYIRNAHRCSGSFFLSFFLGFRRPNLITGLSG